MDNDQSISGRAEKFPFAASRLQLMYATVVGVQEIGTVGNVVRMRGSHRAARPFRTNRRRRSPMLANFYWQLDRVLDLVLNAGRPGRHQTALSCLPAAAHGVYALSFHRYEPPIYKYERRKVFKSKFRNLLDALRPESVVTKSDTSALRA
jgi:hypothetical protein